MNVEFDEKIPPSHADYLACGQVTLAGGGHLLRAVEVFWYDDNRLRIRVPHGAPVVIDGAYIEGKGRDVNLKLRKP